MIHGEKLSRGPIVLAAIVCGILATIGLSLSLYTQFNTPGVEEVPIYADGKFVRMESKLILLWVFPVFQIIISLVFAYYGLRWNAFSRRMLANEKYYRDKMGWPQLDSQSLLQGVCAGFCIFSVLCLLLNIETCLSLLSRP